MVDTRRFAAEGDRSRLGTDGALQANVILQNRYRIENVLGVGGMGSVYQARDMQFPAAKRYVAVKEMLHHTNDPALRDLALRNFHREANILAGLNHPAIPTIHDYFSTKDRAYLVMEFINGSDLDSILSKHDGFLPVQQVVEWCITLCDVLAYLHNGEPPIIFRDVKPSNIMIDVYGRLRLIDFGIAKHFEPEAKGTMIGTEGYAAPESYKGMATPASDVFGVGATMHHIFTGHDPRLEPPFTFAERPIKDANPDIPDELIKVVSKALAYAPAERFATAEEMKQVLERILTGGRAVGMGLASASGAAGDEAWDDNAGGSVGLEPRWKFEVEEEIRTKPAISQGLAYVTAYDNNLYALETDTGQLKWKFAAEDVIGSSPSVDEAEGMVFFGSKDYSMYAVDTRTGRIRWSFQAQAPIFSSPAVEHGHVFFGADDGNLYALRLSTGRTAWKQPMHDPIRCKPAVTNDRIVFGTKSGELIAVDLGGQIKWRFKARKEILSSPLVHNNIAYVGSLDGHVYAVDINTSWAVWRFQTDKPVVSSPCFGEGRIYVGSVNGTLYAFDPESGRERWQYKTESQITSSPDYFEGGVYFGTNEGKFYCLEAKTGKERWVYQAGGSIPGSPTVHNGVVYFGSTDHFLYAFKA